MYNKQGMKEPDARTCYKIAASQKSICFTYDDTFAQIVDLLRANAALFLGYT